MTTEVAIINYEDIEVGERFREDYGDLDELATSIKERGLIQPLAVERLDGGRYLLLAGGRRYMALLKARISAIPVRIYPSGISDLERRSIELAENIHRKDMSWQEQVRLQREIHDLQIAIHGEKISTAPGASGWSMTDTANMLGVHKSSVNKDLQLSVALETNPELFEDCQTKADATKVMKKVTEKILLDELTRRAATKPATSCKSLIDCYLLEDFFTGVKRVPNKSIGLVEIDPPYGIDLKNIKKSDAPNAAKTAADYNEVDSQDYPTFIREVLKECYRVMQDHSWLVLWFAPEPWFEDMYQALRDTGFTTNRMCGVWIKPSGQSMQPATNMANCYEMFFLARKGSPVLTKQGRSNVFQFSPVPSANKIHPTERPIELIEELLSSYGKPGDRVLVPFLGSGTTLIAASNVGMSGLGFDISPEYRDRYILKLHKEGK